MVRTWPSTSSSDFSEEEEEEEEEQEENPLDTLFLGDHYTTERTTLHVVDHSPGLFFPDTTERTLRELTGGRDDVDVVRLAEDEAEKLGQLHLFPAYVVTNPRGVFRLYGNAEQMRAFMELLNF